MKKKGLNKSKIIYFILIVLLMSNSYILAKYTSALRGSSAADVAKWNVVCTSNSPNTLNLVSGNTTQTYVLNVTSVSEVSTNYSVVLSNVPSELEAKIDSGDYQIPNNNNVVTFNNVGSWGPNDVNTTYTHTITFNAPLDSIIPASTQVNIDVIFTQID